MNLFRHLFSAGNGSADGASRDADGRAASAAPENTAGEPGGEFLRGMLIGELARQGALNPALAAMVVDVSGLESAEDTASELAARVDALRRSESYLFIGRGDGMATGLSHGGTETDADQMSDYDYYSRIRMRDSAQN